MVAVCHLARNLPVAPSGETEAIIFRQLALVANGQAAVGLFLSISGFCIHFGQSTQLRVEAVPFMIKRTVRIGLPLVIVSVFASSLGNWATAALNSVLWSLYCELAYYLTYPILLACRRKWPMSRLLIVAVLTSALMVSMQPRRDFLQDYGLATVLVCYPLWLAGAWAERHHHPRSGSIVSIAIWRLVALALCWLFPLGPYGPVDVSAAVKLAFVGVFSFVYIPAELARWHGRKASTWSETLGRGSYSLYLVHILPVAFFMLVPMGISLALNGRCNSCNRRRYLDCISALRSSRPSLGEVSRTSEVGPWSVRERRSIVPKIGATG